MGLLIPHKVASCIAVLAKPHPSLGTCCWRWRGRLNRNGYGRVWWQGREPVVHRVLYELLIGPIPENYLLDHLCRRRDCCNPWHMEPVTVQENTLRGEAVLFARTEP